MRYQYLLLLFAIVGSTTLTLTAQSSAPGPAAGSQPVTTLTTETRSVILDVLVTDARGNAVSGLTKDDFLIREDNQPQTTLSFEAITTSGVPTESTPRTILLLDTMNTRFQDTAFARSAVDRLLRRAGSQLAHPTALYVLGNQGLTIAQPLTRNPAAIDAALRAVPASLPWRLSGDRDSMRDRLNLSVIALRQIALANIGVSGHKDLIWISPGFPLWSTLDADKAARDGVVDQLRQISNQLLQARITIDSVDPRGFLPPTSATLPQLGQKPQQQPTQQNAFSAYLNSLANFGRMNFGDFAIQTLATETGGHVFYGRNDINAGIASAIRNSDAYYSLSYAPSDHNFHGEFRKLQVSLPRQSGLTVKTRDGYYALKESAAATSEREFNELGASLFAPLEYHAIPILLTEARRTGSPHELSARLLVPSLALTWHPDEHGTGLVAALMLAAAEKGRDGKWRQSLLQPYHVVIAAGGAPSADHQASLTFNVPYTDRDRLRFVVQDQATGRIGSSEIALHPKH